MAQPSQRAPLDASTVVVKLTKQAKSIPAIDSPEVKGIKAFTDHMILVPWSSQCGWSVPEVIPFGPLPLLPGASVCQYATNCFEGMKVFRGFDGRLRLLRPLFNCNRMVASAERISLPKFDPEQLLKLIHKICATEAPKWLPKEQGGSSLYVRPTLMGTDASLGFKVPEEALLVIFMMYWPPPPKPLPGTTIGQKLLASSETSVRAWPKGTGEAKIGANYGPALFEHREARRRGYDQILCLFGPDRLITEAGATNFFAMIRSESGELELATPPHDDDMLILRGGTRRNVLELSRQMFRETEGDVERLQITERKIPISELVQAHDAGRLVSVFVVGTAFWIQPVSEIHVDGRDINPPIGQTPHVAVLRERLESIVYGKEASDWMDIVDESQ